MASERVLEIRRIEEFQFAASDQESSKLFTDLPGEIRDLIYGYALADFEDMNNEYDKYTCYKRPEYLAPRKTDTAILRTCQAIYAEAWYLPWTSARHIFYLAQPARKPTKTTTVEQMTDMVAMIETLHPDTPSRRKEVHQIQVFAQAFQLEPGNSLNSILQIPHFSPKIVTITLRHTDMWWWESDTPMHLTPKFVSDVQFPASVTCIEMQIESLERRKAQIDYMTSRITSEWYFKRTDDVQLVPRATATTRWTGSSTWEGQRWVGDEDDEFPGELQYYISTVTFLPALGHATRPAASFSHIHIPDSIAQQNRRVINQGSFTTRALQKLGITDSVPMSEVNRLVSEERIRQRRERQAQRVAQRLALQSNTHPTS